MNRHGRSFMAQSVRMNVSDTGLKLGKIGKSAPIATLMNMGWPIKKEFKFSIKILLPVLFPVHYYTILQCTYTVCAYISV